MLKFLHRTVPCPYTLLCSLIVFVEDMLDFNHTLVS